MASTKTPKPRLTYIRILSVEVPSRPLFEKLQTYLAPYFTDGADNMCTWDMFNELANECIGKKDNYLSSSEPCEIYDQEVHDFIASISRMAEGGIGDVVFYCSNQ